MGDHQHGTRARVGGNAGDQPLRVEFGREGSAFLDLVGRTADGE